MLSRERSPFEWYLSCCSNQVWGGGDPEDVKYTFLAMHAPHFESHDAAARVIDAMPPRVVGALLCDGLGWLHPSGALRREPDVLPFGRGVASTSAGAQTFWAAVSASVRGAPPPDAALPWGLLACEGWSLVRSAGGVPERVPAPCGSCFLWWPPATVALLTPANVRRERVVAADAAGVRRVQRTLDMAALPDVLA